MEGYTNISGNHEDFDDLDIEGRITLDEWNCEEETAEQEETASEREEKRLLSIKVKLDEGGYGYVFSIKATDHSVRWRCHLCDVLIISQKHVDTHIQSKKHQVKLALPSHPSDLFTRVENKTLVEIPQLAPGEPVPPGFEDVVKRVTQIQATLDSHTSSPLIGLEYVVELTPDERGKEPMYVCMLCDKKGDPRVAMAHITSFNHRSKYIGIHYPTANKAIFNEFPRSKDGRRCVSEIVTRICAKIEEKYGRLQPLVVEKDTFETKRDQIMQQIREERHFRETPDETFIELVDKSVMDTLIAVPEEPPAPKPEPKTEIEVKSTFVKGKITCDRSRLRIRDAEDVEDEMKFGKYEPERKRLGSKKFKYGDPNRKSLSSVSSVSSSSRSRSRSRSRSLSRSRSRSYSRSRYGRHGRREGKYGRGRWRRSRSGSRGWRRSRSGSRPHSRRSRSGSRHGRRSPDSPGRRYQYGHSHSPKYIRYRENQNDDRYKFRDKSDRDKSELDPRILEKTKWMKFRQEVDKVERELAKELKFHEKNPEKHPMYPEEWKKFWNRRYKELQADGKDPSKHDFKPEWIEFWNSRMKEMHEENLKTKKEDLKMKLGLPNEQEIMPFRANRKNRSGQDLDVVIISPTQGSEDEVVKKDVTVTDIKNTWKALTGSDIKDSSKRSPSPWEEGEPVLKHARGLSPTRKPMRGLNSRGRGGRMGNRPYFRNNDDTDGGGVVTVLRLLTALESQLGSLGPRVNTLLASALSLEKASPSSSNKLLTNSDNFVLLETIKEKLKGQLLAGIVERNMVMATRLCISSLADLLIKAEESIVPPLQSVAVAPTVVDPSSATVTLPSVSVTPSVQRIASITAIPAAEPVTVPGVGAVDKIAIAKQIAAALIAQGKTDVTHEELEQLINAVVGMAQASAGCEHPISAATYVSQMQQQLGGNSESISTVGGPVNKIANKTPLQKLLSVVTSTPASTSSTNPINTIAKSEELRTNALALLQSAYEEPKRSPVRQTIPNKASVSHKVTVKDLMSIFKNPSPSHISENLDSGHIKHGMEDLSEQDLQTLLQNFKDLSPVEQQGLITYLKKLETIEPERVEKLRQYVHLGAGGDQDSLQNLKSSLISSSFNRPAQQSGRLSPFSLRQGGINPSLESEQQMKSSFPKKEIEDQKRSLKLDDSDDDYSFEDIYNAASQKLKEREKAKLEEEKMKQLTEESKERDEKTKNKTDDPNLILKETKEMIANLMGQLPSKFIQKQSGSPGSRKDSPAVMGHQTGASIANQKTDIKFDMELGGQRIQALGSSTSQMIKPTVEAVQPPQPQDSSQHMYQGYSNSESSYNNQYGSQDYSRGQHPYSGSQHPGYSGGYQQSSGYYGSSQQQYPQNPSGSYDAYANQGPSGGSWNQYSDQYGQQPYRQPGPGPYSQYPNQSSGYY